MTINILFNKAHEEEVYKNEKAVICFSAEWCSPCKKFAPIYSTYANEYKDIKFYKVDIDDSEDLVNKFNITSVPTFIFLKKGEKVYEIIGTDEKQFAFFIQELYYFR